ncbi:C-type lectin domain family 12 member B-like isoform X1 [Parambassis ranga]|uniref:C-type lectin domain family 12 member B-like isoform X1 n=1 Tax=Parambassis ranga TaxID=210632 RepID=A0A6P7K3Y8_9TELE|nr:C-type lectin domain family 12 member B-like isoform X1 [Parambassis ranga]
MAEEELNYASVVFRNKNSSRSEVKKEEDTVYDQVKVRNDGQTAKLVPDKKADGRRFQYQHLACCLGALCVILLFGIIALIVIYVATLNPDVTQLEELKHNQTVLITENENLKRDNKNLTQAYTVLDNKVANLTAENHNIQLKNQQLEMDKKNLTAQLENKETAEMELNISRAQWTYDQYCKINAGGKCQGCQKGWLLSGSNCYAVNNAEPSNQRSWEKAREDCRGKISDLVVVVNEAEKNYVSSISWLIGGVDPGYWLGLRVEDGKWKWVDGSDLTDLSWIQQHPATEGQCAISLSSNKWKSVSCNEKKPWICKKKALTL